MTAIAALIGPDPSAHNLAQIERTLGAMGARGADHLDHWRDSTVTLGIARFDWERARSDVHAPGIAHRGPLTVAADATLYYRDDLRRTIAARGTSAPGDTPAALILAAYEAFGDACVSHLEGDFAFLLWDAQRARLFAARDFVGKRSLYYSQRAGDDRATLSLASTVGGLIADRRVPRDLNMATVAAVAAGLWVNSKDTCYAAISELGAGHTLVWEREHGVRIARAWSPPTATVRGTRSMDDAAEELRSLLTRATDERMSRDGPTGVSLSGGWDSTAVFGAGQNALQKAPNALRALRPVSISYPEGDPGREDDFITETTARWNTASAWIDVNTIPMFDDALAAARAREEPWSHPYEQWNRALARSAREMPARALLDGVGGDSLFQVSGVFLADLFQQGRWLELRRQWRIGGGGGLRAFLRAAVKPALPDVALRALAAVRRTGPASHYLTRRPSAWFRSAYLREHGVLEHEQRDTPPLPRSNRVLAETHAYLTYPAFPRLMSRLFTFALGEGVELRSPLLDSRVVNFAVGRPWYERADGAETKILLRRSMRGLLPDRLLAPRPHRTGITSGYFNRCLQGPGRPVVERAMRDSVLASMGMIDPTALARAWEYYLRTSDDEVGVRVYFTIQTELWLREHQHAPVASGA